MFCNFLLIHASATLAGQKAGSLFRVPRILWSRKALSSLLQTTQLLCIPLQASSRSILVYLYDPQLLENILSQSDNISYLMQLGYSGNPDRALQMMLEKLEKSCIFPHEVGLFLGYPLQDVQGYIENKGQNCLYAGYWKVYHNVREAKQQFYRYDRCWEFCKQEQQAGASPDEILHALRKL